MIFEYLRRQTVPLGFERRQAHWFVQFFLLEGEAFLQVECNRIAFAREMPTEPSSQ